MIISCYDTSMKDYVGKIALVLYAMDCNLDCPWCYNKRAFLPAQPMDAEDALSNLTKCHNAVVFLGGEPTCYVDLPDLCRKVKNTGRAVKVFTNGMRPDRLQQCIEYVDLVSLDVKETKNVADRIGIDITNKKYLDTIAKSAEICKNKLEIRITFTDEAHRNRCHEFAKKLGSQPIFFQQQVKVNDKNLR